MRIAVVAAAVCLSIVGLSEAQNAKAAMRLDTHIPAESLGTALKSFAQERNLQILYFSDAVRDVHTGGAVGQLTTDEALTQLLSGTGLTYRYVSDKAITILPASTGSAGSPSGTTSPSTSPPTTSADQREGKTPTSGAFLLAQASSAASAGGVSLGEQATQTPERAGQLQEIVVTAQKRSENIQDVPLSVSAMSAERLAQFNYTQLSDYAATIPGLQVDSGGAPGWATVTLRGISTGNLYGSATTAIYVDDVPVGASGSYSYGASFDGLDLLPYDLDHVEVLKGPQGTLYGASSMGGLLKYVLSTPDPRKDSFRVGTDISTIDGGSGVGYGFRGYASVAIVPDELAVSISGAHTYTPGFVTNVANGQNGINHGSQDGARIAVLWQPANELTIKLAAMINHSDFDYVGEIPLTPVGQPQFGAFDAQWFFRNGLVVQDTLYSADIAYNFGWATLTSVSGYFGATSNEPEDGTIYPFFSQVLGVYAPAVDQETLEKFSQELRLASPINQKIQWVLGGFFTKEDAALFENIHALNPATGLANPLYEPLDDIRRPSDFKEEAAYGNATVELTSQWDINGGVRYSHNDQSVSTYGLSTNGSGGYLFGSLTAPYSTPLFKFSEGTTTWSASSRYHLTPDAMLYARVATGYRPGGSNTGVPGAPPTFSADTLTNYEFGVKSEILDKRLLLNADVFYIDWKNIQLGAYTAAHLIFTGNAGTAFSDGVEATAEYAVTPELRLSVNTVYNDAKLTEDAPAVGGADGDRLPLSPQWSGSVTGEWNHPIGDSYTLISAVVWRYVGNRNTDFPGGGGIPGGSNYLHLPSYDTVDLSAGLTNGRWTARIFARNLANETAYLRYYAPAATLLQPRTVGLSVDVAF